MDLDLDITPESSSDYLRAQRRRRRWRNALLTAFFVLACLALGIGLGWLVGQKGDEAASDRAAEQGQPPAATSNAVSAGGYAGAAASQTEAERAVTRRLAGVAFDEAGQLVARGVAAGLSRSLGGSAAAASGEPAQTSVPGGSAAETPGAGAVAPGGSAAPGQPPTSPASTAAAPPTPATATAAPRAPEPRSEASRDESHHESPSPNRWVDPTVPEVDYDFSVPFEERQDRSRERLLHMEQEDPYSE